jgi:hypothetical protein
MLHADQSAPGMPLGDRPLEDSIWRNSNETIIDVRPAIVGRDLNS